MKRLARPLLLAALALAGAAHAQSAPELVLQPGARLSIDGTSTVRAFTCQAESLLARLEPGEGGSLALAQLPGAVRGAVLTVPTQKLKCGDRTMDEHMYNALKAKQFPSIRFQLEGYEVGAKRGEQVALRLKGTLTLAGQTRPILVLAQARQGAGGTLLVEGRHTLKMTEWGVQPPSLMFGAMRVGEDVQLSFQLGLKAAAPQAAAPQG